MPMKPKLIYAILAAVIGEALIVTLNILFRGDLPNNVLVLNIIVCTLAYICSGWWLFVRWDRSEDKVETWVGTLGVNLWGFGVYSTLAIIALFVMNLHATVDNFSDTYPVEFKYQLLVQGALFMFLILTRFFSHTVAGQVENVHVKETALVSGLDEMKSATRRLQDAAFMCENMDPSLRSILNDIQLNLRYLSPVKSSEAHEIESEYVAKVNALIPAFINYKMNEDSIAKQLGILKHLVDNRKKIYN